MFCLKLLKGISFTLHVAVLQRLFQYVPPPELTTLQTTDYVLARL